MFKIMSRSAFTLVILFILCPFTLQQTLPPKAVNAERIKLLKDALSWMTFRKNGQLANDQDLEPYFETLKAKYVRSKYYRTMIIAFSRAVLPKLTLKENDPCDSAYTLEYRDSLNNSVTDGRIKNFTILSYDKREDASRQFCDYREGLLCNQQTNRCECPPGSKMEPISQGSPIKRCLVQENEVCSLIDLDHDPTSNYGALKKLLPEMVFNLEKPLSCKMGTQCRFKSTNPTTPLCYTANSGPWDRGRWDIDFGEECTLGLYGDTGQCKIKQYRFPAISATFDGFTCFNYGPRSQSESPHVGFCDYDAGSYSLGSITLETSSGASTRLYWDLQMIGFVSPATTPLRGQRLFQFQANYTDKLSGSFTILTVTPSPMALSAGSRCNIGKSEKMLQLWTFFENLEKNRPQGNNDLVTEAQLEDKLKEAEELTVDNNKKICQYRSEFYSYSEFDRNPALRCVRNSTDAAGNDGRCEEIPANEDVTLEWAKKFFRYRVHVKMTKDLLRREERLYRKDIFEPELECDPKLGPPPNSAGAVASTDSDVLEGGYCPPDRGCIEDYGDYQEIYHSRNCSLREAKPRIWRNCQDLDDSRRYEKCEDKHLDKIFDEELQTVSSYAGLQRGAACQYELEMKIRSWIEGDGKENKYKRLIELDNFKKGIGGTRLCDRTKLLECSPSGTCECLTNTQPREVTLEGNMNYYSDHCYVSSGGCDPDRNLRHIFSKSSQIESNEISRHYKRREGEGVWYQHCTQANWCVFLKGDADCTTENTGSTGHTGEDPVTTTTTARITSSTDQTGESTTTDETDEGNLMCEDSECGWQEAGEARKETHVILMMIILIKILTIMV